MYTWSKVNELLDCCGGSAYIFNPSVFQKNVASFLQSFQTHYPNTTIGYSYKTNYLPKLCREANRLGLYAEVVSGMEYELARRVDVPDSKIIFNGPVKTESELKIAISKGATINIDSMDEVKLIAALFSDIPKSKAKIGLRCNLGFQYQGRPSRFGLSDSNGDLWKAAELIKTIPNMKLSGLHCHFSFDRSTKSYQDRTKKMVITARKLFPDCPPEYIDIGGGFCGPMPAELEIQLKSASPSYSEYAEKITQILVSEYGEKNGPELILEPGVGLVADVMTYACRIEIIKKIPERSFAVTSGSQNHLKMIPNNINLPIRILNDPQGGGKLHQHVDIVGFTCLEHDIMYHHFSGELNRGDIILFKNVGAYSFVSSPTFIRATPPIVMWDQDNEWKILKKPFSADELFQQFSY